MSIKILYQSGNLCQLQNLRSFETANNVMNGITDKWHSSDNMGQTNPKHDKHAIMK